LPSGQTNIRARYRKGIGLEGLVKGGQLSMLLTRPLGVKGVINPTASAGAQDPEVLDDARANAPLKVLTLERVVSLSDYEDFARAFGGIAKALAAWTWNKHSRGVLVTVAGPNGVAVEAGSATYNNLLAAMRAAGDPFVELRVMTYRPAYFRFAGSVDVDKFYRSGSAATLQQRLLAEQSITLPNGQLAAAELLTLDPAPLDQLGVMA
jgi:predicted phage baseplate assembly protein